MAGKTPNVALLQLFVGFLVGVVFVSVFSTARVGDEHATPSGPTGRQRSRANVAALASAAMDVARSHSTGAHDDLYLGDPTSFEPAPRRADYVYRSNAYQKLYDTTWTQGGYPAQSCWGCRFAVDVTTKLTFHTMLDAGTGNGALVRLMRAHGKNAYGIELSAAVLEQECPDLLGKGFVEAGILTNLPYADNAFDLVFSADVLEHVHEDEVEAVIKELVRVSRRHLFLSISLKGHTKATAGNDAEAHRHTMLRPRAWWHDAFRRNGAVVNEDMLWAMQEKDFSYNGDDTLKDCRTEGSPPSTYQVCVVDNTWLVGKREQANVRKDRCITTSNHELEPWFFAFRKMR